MNNICQIPIIPALLISIVETDGKHGPCGFSRNRDRMMWNEYPIHGFGIDNHGLSDEDARQMMVSRGLMVMFGAGCLISGVGGVMTPAYILCGLAFILFLSFVFPLSFFSRTLLACAAQTNCYNFSSTLGVGRTIKPRGGYWMEVPGGKVESGRQHRMKFLYCENV